MGAVQTRLEQLIMKNREIAKSLETKGSVTVRSVETPMPRNMVIGNKMVEDMGKVSQKEYVSKDQFRSMFPKASKLEVDKAHGAFNANAEKYGLTNKRSQNIFFGQTAHETGGKIFGGGENLNYTEDRLKETFKKFRDNPELAKKYGRTKDHAANKVMIGNIAYGDRMGNTEAGDGYKYRGWGNIQLTGKTNYADTAAYMGMSTEELLSHRGDDGYKMISSMAWYHKRGVHEAPTTDAATKLINQHTSSYKDRREWVNKFSGIFQ